MTLQAVKELRELIQEMLSDRLLPEGYTIKTVQAQTIRDYLDDRIQQDLRTLEIKGARQLGKVKPSEAFTREQFDQNIQDIKSDLNDLRDQMESRLICRIGKFEIRKQSTPPARPRSGAS